MSTGSNFNGWISKINDIVVSSLEDIKKQDITPSSNPGKTSAKSGNSDKLVANTGGVSSNGGNSTNGGSSPKSSGIVPQSGGIIPQSGGISPKSENLDEKLASSSTADEKEKIEMNKDTLGIKSFFATNSLIASKFKQKIEAERGNLQKLEPISVDILNNRAITQGGLTANFKNVKAYNLHSFQIGEVVADKDKGIITYNVTFPFVKLKADVALSGTSNWGGTIDIKFVQPSSKGEVRFQIEPTSKMLGIELGYEYKSIEVTGPSDAKVGTLLAGSLDKYLTQNKKDIVAKAKQAIMKALENIDQAALVDK